MQIEDAIRSGISEAIHSIYGNLVADEAVKLEATNPDFKGDFTFVTFPFLKISKKNPEETAKDIGHYLKEKIEQIQAFNVVRGFLNLELNENYWLDRFAFLNTVITAKNHGRVMVEYSSPNTNKPLHLGHIRNNLLGFSVANILAKSGYEVIKANLINDRGIHICKSMLAWQKWGNGETPGSTGIKGDHLVGKYYVEFDRHYKSELEMLTGNGLSNEEAEKQSVLMEEARALLRKWEDGDTAVRTLWKTMNEWVYSGFKETYKRLGVEFDQYYYESETYLMGKDFVEEGLSRGVFFRKADNSVWIDLKEDGLDEKLVLRSDGTSVYITQDIGTAIEKYNKYKCDRFIYVVGNEQDYHFKVLFLILKKMGWEWANGFHHLSYGMVDLPSGKMKSREGTVVDADELMDEMVHTAKNKTEELGKTDGMADDEKNALYNTLGMGALKFFMLKVDPQKRMMFNPAESIDFQGDTGPFVQYTYARIRSLLKAANQKEMTMMFQVENVHESELNLIKVLCEYKHELMKAAAAYSPSILAAYVLKLAKAFNRVYNDVSFLKETDEQLRIFRIQLAMKTSASLVECLTMLGISCPDRM